MKKIKIIKKPGTNDNNDTSVPKKIIIRSTKATIKPTETQELTILGTEAETVSSQKDALEVIEDSPPIKKVSIKIIKPKSKPGAIKETKDEELTFIIPEKVELRTFKESDGRCSFIIYFPKISQEDIEILTSHLDNIPEDDWIHGKFMGRDIPRLIRWYETGGGTYKFSGKKYHPFPYEKWLLEFQDKLNRELNIAFDKLRAECPEFDGFNLNSVLINKYRSGSDSVSWHSDDEPEFGINPAIVSVSLGQPRTFEVKRMSESVREKTMNKRGIPFVPDNNYKSESYKFNLGEGSLLVMGGAFQDYWLHSVPKQEGLKGVRYNLTFRPYIKK